MNNKILENTLLSKNVRERFYKEYSNIEFKNWLLSILPEVEDAKNCSQNNSWHIYNVLDHILVSVEEMNKLTSDMSNKDKKELAYIMFLHDMGKPKHHLTTERNGKLVDIFPNHPEGSAIIAQRVLSQFGFSDEENMVMSNLILNHDLFTKVLKNPERKDQVKLSKELIEKLIEQFNNYGNGEELLEKLITIGTADNKAQNPVLTKEPLEVLKEAQNILREIINSKEKV